MRLPALLRRAPKRGTEPAPTPRPVDVLNRIRTEAHTTRDDANRALNASAQSRAETKTIWAAAHEIRALIEIDPDDRTESHEQRLLYQVNVIAEAASRSTSTAKRAARHTYAAAAAAERTYNLAQDAAQRARLRQQEQAAEASAQ